MRYRIITAPRTKATHVLNCIMHSNNADQYKLPSEYYNEPYNADMYKQAVDWMLEDNNAVVKHHIRHLIAEDVYPGKQMLQIENTVDWHTIVVLRRDLFAQAVSYARSRTTNQWSIYDTQSISIDVDLFERCVKALWASVNYIVENKNKIRYDRVVFSEDITGDVKKDCKLLNISTVENIPTTERSPVNSVENIEQLKKHVTEINLLHADLLDSQLIISEDIIDLLL